MHCPTIVAHPLRREIAVFTGTYVPLSGEIGCGPWTPWLGRIVHAESTSEACVTTIGSTGVLRKLLPPKITLEGSAVGDGGTETRAGMAEHGPAFSDISRPD